MLIIHGQIFLSVGSLRLKFDDSKTLRKSYLLIKPHQQNLWSNILFNEALSSSNKKSRVLVTGASGFIGIHCLLPLIEHGYEVFAIYQTRRHDLPNVRWVKADLLRSSELRSLMEDIRPTHLLHLAWYVEPGKMIDAEENLSWVSTSLELLQLFRQHGGERCVISGSCYEYDWRFGYCSEELTPIRPDTLYGAAKSALRMQSFCLKLGLSIAWARMFFLYGPHENPRRLVPSVILSLLAGKPALSSHGEQIRDYMHVMDVAEGLIALLNSNAQGIFNIASGHAVTIRMIVEQIGLLMEQSSLLRIGALSARANDAPLVVADTRHTEHTIGWRSRIPLDRGLTETIDWWRAEFRGQQNKVTDQ